MPSLTRPLSNISNQASDTLIPPGTYPPGTVLNVNGIEVVVERYLAEGIYEFNQKEDLRMYIWFGFPKCRRDWC